MIILLVEDEAKTGENLRQGLAEAGHTTDGVLDSLSGRHQALSGEDDPVIPDMVLPGLFLTARDPVEARVQGREPGAQVVL